MAQTSINIRMDSELKNAFEDFIALIKYLTEDSKFDKIFENQQVLKTPIVRNGKLATVGYCPEVWKGWE